MNLGLQFTSEQITTTTNQPTNRSNDAKAVPILPPKEEAPEIVVAHLEANLRMLGWLP